MSTPYFELEGKTYKLVEYHDLPPDIGSCRACAFCYGYPVAHCTLAPLHSPAALGKSISCMGGVFVEVQESLL